MREIPIIFSGEMVRAILDGRKTMTRRVVKRFSLFFRRPGMPFRQSWPGNGFWNGKQYEPDLNEVAKLCPYGQPGDHLWVRESFRLRADQDGKPPREDWWKSGAWYPADGPHTMPSGCAGGSGRLRPSIHMPRWASRITLEVTGVRVERLQEITEGDAKLEGLQHHGAHYWQSASCGWASLRGAFHSLWDSINAKRGFGWDVNPLVWVISFKRLTPSDTRRNEDIENG